MSNEFFYGTIQMSLGLIILLFLKDEVSSQDYQSICIIWAVWSILRESREIEEAVIKMCKRIPVFLDLMESIVCIVFSILLIINPNEHHALIHIYLLSVELFTICLFPLLGDIYAKRHHIE